jgi:hypothetical protein
VINGMLELSYGAGNCTVSLLMRIPTPRCSVIRLTARSQLQARGHQ